MPYRDREDLRGSCGSDAAGEAMREVEDQWLLPCSTPPTRISRPRSAAPPR